MQDVSERERAYREAVAAVQKIIDQYDPEGLLAMGAPDDEYEPEAHDLVRFVLGTDAPTTEIVRATWHRWFSTDLQPDVEDAINSSLQSLRSSISDP